MMPVILPDRHHDGQQLADDHSSTATGTTGKTVLFKFAPDGTVIFSRYLTVPSGWEYPH